MPHQCVHCGELYPTASKELLEGCTCGSHFFFFVREEDLSELKKETENLSTEDKIEIEEDIRDIIGLGQDEVKPVVLDLESIRVLKPGKFEIDIVNLFRKKPLVYKLEEGRYVIDIASTFKAGTDKHKAKG